MIKLEIGQSAITKRTFSPADVAEFAALAGSKPPNDERVVPGPLLGGMFSYLLGTQCPGRGTNYLKQRLEFLAPAMVGEELVASVEVIRIRPDKDLVNLRTICTNAAGRVVCQGEALVHVQDVE